MLAATVLSGCAAWAPKPPADGVLSGRLAVRIQSEPARSMSSTFELGGAEADGWLRLIGPLGATVAEARWDTAGAVLTTSNDERHYDSLDALSQDVLGDRFPLAALPDWLRGRPWAGAPSRPLDAADPPSSPGAAADAATAPHGIRPGFEQLGWIVDLGRFDRGAVGATRAAPTVMTVRVLLDR